MIHQLHLDLTVPTISQVNSIRDEEIAVLKRSAWLNAIVSFVWNNVPILFTLASFTTFVLQDPDSNVLDANK